MAFAEPQRNVAHGRPAAGASRAARSPGFRTILASRAVVFVTLWFVSVHAPCCCIVHCACTESHAALARGAPLVAQFACAVSHISGDTHESLPPVDALPPVMYPAIVEPIGELMLPLRAIDWFGVSQAVPVYRAIPPPTPPPRVM